MILVVLWLMAYSGCGLWGVRWWRRVLIVVALAVGGQEREREREREGQQREDEIWEF